MSKHDSTRRSFLVRAAVGAGAAAGSGLVPIFTPDASASLSKRQPNSCTPTPFSMARFSIMSRPRRLQPSLSGSCQERQANPERLTLEW